MSVIFDWQESEMLELLASCSVDEAWPLIEAYFPQGSRVLEAGCGAGRWLRFMTDRGYQMVGLEYKGETVDMVKRTWPDLDVIQGDCEASPFPADSFDGVLSFGVVEHWMEGPEKPLADIFRVLKPGGVAFISVPCQNTIRRFKKVLWVDEILGAPRAIAKRILRSKKMPLSRLDRRYRFHMFPALGEFFEYRLTPEEFLGVIRAAGFEVLTHQPVATFDGIYHDLNPFGLVVEWKGFKFRPTRLALWLHETLKKKPFFHPHMQAVIVRKPVKP